MNTSKPLALFLAGVLLFTHLTPPLAAMAAAADSQEVKAEEKAEKIAMKAELNEEKVKEKKWSEYDWDEEQVLPHNMEEYLNALDRLEEKDDGKAIAQLKIGKSRLGDDEVMERYEIPLEVKQFVKESKRNSAVGKKDGKAEKDVELTDEEEKELSKQLAQVDGISQSKAKEKGFTPDNELPVINISDAKPVEKNQLKEEKDNAKDVKSELKQAPDYEREEKSKKGIIAERSSRQSAFTAFLTINTPIIEYYPGIENNPVENALYYLSQHQNDDGSFGVSRLIETTYEISLLLSRYKLTANDQYTAAVNYLLGSTPQNNREKAIKALVLYAQNQAFQPLLDELAGNTNEDGGFGYDYGYSSDIDTTLAVIKAFSTAGQKNTEIVIPGLKFVVSQIKTDGRITVGGDANPSYYLMNLVAEKLQPFGDSSISVNGSTVIVKNEVGRMLDFLASKYDTVSEHLDKSTGAIDELMLLANLREYNRNPELQNTLYTALKYTQALNGAFGDTLFDTIAALKGMARPDLSIELISTTSNLQKGSAFTMNIKINNNGYAAANGVTLSSFMDKVRVYSPSVSSAVVPPKTTGTLAINFGGSSRLLGDTEVTFLAETTNESKGDDNWRAQRFTFAADASQTPAYPLFFIFHKTKPSGGIGVNVRFAKRDDPNRSKFYFHPVGSKPRGFSPIVTPLSRAVQWSHA